MGLLMTRCAEDDQILGRVISTSAPPLNMMDLEILRPPARLATPTVSLEDFPAELAISFWVKAQTGSLCADPFQSVT